MASTSTHKSIESPHSANLTHLGMMGDTLGDFGNNSPSEDPSYFSGLDSPSAGCNFEGTHIWDRLKECSVDSILDSAHSLNILEVLLGMVDEKKEGIVVWLVVVAGMLAELLPFECRIGWVEGGFD